MKNTIVFSPNPAVNRIARTLRLRVSSASGPGGQLPLRYTFKAST